MTPKLKFDDLPFLPRLIAETVAGTPYTAQEWAPGLRSGNTIAEIEALRQRMHPHQIKEFADLCDARCRLAFGARVQWFMKMARARGAGGRDQLYVYMSHWLAAYLKAPEPFRRSAETRANHHLEKGR